LRRFWECNILGVEAEDPCATCWRDSFSALARPIDDTPHVHRVMWVRTCCPRCHRVPWTGITGPPAHVAREVFLPVAIVKGSQGFVNKSRSIFVLGQKPPNDRLQIANLCGQSRVDDVTTWHVEKLGFAAVCDEIHARPVGYVEPLALQKVCELAIATCAIPMMEIYLWWRGWLSGRRAAYCLPRGVVAGLLMKLFQRVRSSSLRPMPRQLRDLGHNPHTGDEDRQMPGLAWQLYKASEAAGGGKTTDDADKAERQSIIDEQKAMHINREKLTSSTVVTAAGKHVSDDCTADGEVGVREATTRFPKMTDEPAYLFSGNADNLASAEALRNKGVGNHNPSAREARAREAVTDALIKHLFTKKRVQASEAAITRTVDVLPKKLNEEAKMQVEIDALNQDQDGYVPFSLMVKAFVKPEVTGKPKPRPIANHGERRLWGLAKTAAVFEDLLFHAIPHACIKHEEKAAKMAELFKNTRGFKHVVENDMTAFEFGISRELKVCEQRIFKAIMKHLNLDEDGEGFCHRVVDARDKAVTWVYTYKDAAGAACTCRIKLPRAMRESGDRVTSSGNFLQNLIAWFSYLVDPAHIEAAIESLLRNKGKKFTYVSARDGRKYDAFLAFEGDDTLGGLNEASCGYAELVEEFFKNWGWSSKLRFVKKTGDDFVSFVGFHALTHNGRVMLVGPEEHVVMCPEVKRVLKTKDWTTCSIPDADLKASLAIYAADMMTLFHHVEPMYRFFAAMLADNRPAAGPTIKYGGKANDLIRGVYLRKHGDIGTAKQIEEMEVAVSEFLDGGKVYRRLLDVCAGPSTEEEWACACGVTTLAMHGDDLAAFMPGSWLR